MFVSGLGSLNISFNIELLIPEIAIDTHFQPNQFLLKSSIPLPQPLFDENLKIGLSSVVQDINGDIYYYALSHEKEQADFHAAGSFSLELGQ